MMNDYTPKQALDLLMAKIREASPALHDRIEDVINSGKETQAVYPGSTDRHRSYRKIESLTDIEAFRAALGVLRTHLVESPRMMESALVELAQTAISAPGAPNELWTKHWVEDDGKTKPPFVYGFQVSKKCSASFVIESEPETVQEKRQTEDWVIKAAGEKNLVDLDALLKTLLNQLEPKSELTIE